MTTLGHARFPSRLFTRPLMIQPEAFANLLASADWRAAKDGGAGAPQRERPSALAFQGSGKPFAGRVAIIRVLGPLTYRTVDYWEENITYAELRAAFRQAMADPDVSAVVFDIDSPGGEASGVMEFSDEIFAARGEKPIYAVANPDAFSAAYAIASAADRVFLLPSGTVGSIGVIAVHVDRAKMYADIGFKFTAIYAGAHKVDFAPFEPLSEQAAAVGRKMVDSAMDRFVALVARNRGMSEAAVRDTQAGVFEGEDAVSAGLADAVMDWPGAVARIFSDLEEGKLMGLKEDLQKLVEASGPEDVRTAMEAMGYVPRAGEAPTVLPVEDKLETPAPKTGLSATEILDLADLGGMDAQAAGDLVKVAEAAQASGTPMDAAAIRATIRTARDAKAASAPAITSTVGATGTGEGNPLLDACRGAAEAHQARQKK